MSSSSSSSSDRRRFPRYPTRIEVDWASGESFLFAYVTDISALGIFVQTDDPAPRGRRIRLRFGAPTDPRAAQHYPDLPFELSGEVVWSTGDDGDTERRGMGVQLVDLDDAKRDRIMELVQAVAYLDDPRGD